MKSLVNGLSTGNVLFRFVIGVFILFGVAPVFAYDDCITVGWHLDSQPIKGHPVGFSASASSTDGSIVTMHVYPVGGYVTATSSGNNFIVGTFTATGNYGQSYIIDVGATDDQNHYKLSGSDYTIALPSLLEQRYSGCDSGNGYSITSGTNTTIPVFVGYSSSLGAEGIEVIGDLISGQQGSLFGDPSETTNSSGYANFILQTQKGVEGLNTITFCCPTFTSLSTITINLNQRTPHHIVAETEPQEISKISAPVFAKVVNSSGLPCGDVKIRFDLNPATLGAGLSNNDGCTLGSYVESRTMQGCDSSTNTGAVTNVKLYIYPGTIGTNTVSMSCPDYTEVQAVTCNYTKEVEASPITPHAYADGVIDTWTGQFSMTATDIAIPGRGLGINFTRNYSSQPKRTQKLMDPAGNWTHSYNIYLVDSIKSIVVTAGNGRRDYYDCPTVNGIPTGENYAGRNGIYSKMDVIRADDPPENPITGYTVTEKDGTKYTFNHEVIGVWYCTRIEDRSGNYITLTYKTESGKEHLLASVTDCFNRSISFGYEAGVFGGPAWRIHTVTDDQLSRVLTYNYDTDTDCGFLTNVSGPEGYNAVYEYSKSWLDAWKTVSYMTYFKDPHMQKGFTERKIEYENNNTLALFAKRTRDGDNVLRYEIDYQLSQQFVDSKKWVKVTDGDGKDTKYWYNTAGCWVGTQSPVDVSNDVQKTYTWDENYNQTSVTEQHKVNDVWTTNKWTKFDFDDKGNKTAEKLFNGAGETQLLREQSWTYDSTRFESINLSVLSIAKDSKNNYTKYEYNDKGNLTRTYIQDPVNQGLGNMLLASENIYLSTDDYGQVASSRMYTDGTNYITTYYEYDNIAGSKGYATGQLIKTTIADINGEITPGYVTTAYYDIISRKTKETDTSSLTITNTYDNDDRLTRVDYADGTHVENYYDTNGRLVTVVDAKGVTTRTVYDVRDRVTDVNAANNDASVKTHIRTVYNNDDTKQHVIAYRGVNDSDAIYTRYYYNDDNSLWKEETNSGKITEYTYDIWGKKHTEENANGVTTTYTYDDFDRVTLVSSDNGNSTAYTYDGVTSNIQTSTTITGLTENTNTIVTHYEYDNLYRVTRKYDTYTDTYNGQDLTTHDFYYEYDRAGKKTMEKIGNNGQHMSTNYYYYPNGMLWQESYKSFPSDQPKVTWHYYNAAGKPYWTTYPNHTETLLTYCYETGVTSEKNGRLKKTLNRKEDGGPVISSFEYTYDEVGNRLTMKELRGTSTYTYDNLYRLTEVTYPDTRNVKYFYDRAGNRSSMVETEKTGATPVTTNYTYDSDNRMTVAGSNTYTYDDNGNTTQKASSGQTINYTWKGNGFNQMVKAAYTTGALSATPSLMLYYDDMHRFELKDSNGTTRYVYNGNNTVIETNEKDKITKKYNGGVGFEKYNYNPDGSVASIEKYYYAYDGLGSVVNLMDDAGNIVTVYYYDAIGKSTNVKHDPTNKKQFTGKEVDEDSGLQYFLARYYDPEVGRFLSVDPSQDGINFYVYCFNNPINKVDPDGRAGIDSNLAVQINTQSPSYDISIPVNLGGVYGATSTFLGLTVTLYFDKAMKATSDIKEATELHETIHKKQQRSSTDSKVATKLSMQSSKERELEAYAATVKFVDNRIKELKSKMLETKNKKERADYAKRMAELIHFKSQIIDSYKETK